MSTEVEATSLPIRTATHSSVHPFAPVTKSEIENAAALVKAQWPQGTDLHFKAITLEEPLKAEMVKYLEAEFQGAQPQPIDRKVLVTYYLRMTVRMGHQDGSKRAMLM